MSELTALLGVYAAVDGLVLGDRDLLPALAAVLPVYRWGEDVSAMLGPDQQRVDPTLGWSTKVTELGLPEFTADLPKALAAFEALQEPTHLEQAKRLRAAWMTLQVHPTPDTKAASTWLLRPVVSDARASALVPAFADGEISQGDVDEEPVVEATANLIELLASDAFSTAEDWQRLVEECANRGYASAAVVSLALVSCLDRMTWKKLPSGDIDPVASIHTTVRGFDIGNLTMEQVRTRLQPAAWPECFGSFWCAMEQLDAPPRGPQTASTWCREEVGDCPDHEVWFNPVLRFDMRNQEIEGGGLVGFQIHYGLATPEDMAALNAVRNTVGQQDSRLIDDSGMIIVERQGASADTTLVDIGTTKNIGFLGYPTGAVALLACVTGWADQTRLMMDGCLSP